MSAAVPTRSSASPAGPTTAGGGTRIVVFAKAPVPGLAKTRLIPALGAEGAAELALSMLRATLDSALRAQLGPVELRMTPGPDAPAWRDVWLPGEIEPRDQGTGDLGERLARAAESASARAERFLLIGTDCVEISEDLLLEAAAALSLAAAAPAVPAAPGAPALPDASRSTRGAGRAVIYPAADGGYALLGLTQFDRRLFTNMPWSTPAVADETMRRIRSLGWPLTVGAVLHDIDEPADLAHQPSGRISKTGVKRHA